MANVTIKNDKTNEFLSELDGRLEAALTAIGIQAANYAADKSPVDTGRLRDSMTSVIEEDGGKKCVKIGSAVEYAIYQELGTRRFSGHHMIRNSLADHLEEYKRMVESLLKG